MIEDDDRRLHAKERVEVAKANLAKARAELRAAKDALKALPSKRGMKFGQKISRKSTRQSERASDYIRFELRKHRREIKSKKSKHSFRSEMIEKALAKYPHAVRSVVLENMRLNQGRKLGVD